MVRSSLLKSHRIRCGDLNVLMLFFFADLLKSSRHRVRQPPLPDRSEGPLRMTRARYSIPYFVVADPDTLIECLPVCVDDEHPAKYEPVVQEDWARLRRGIQYPVKKYEFPVASGAVPVTAWYWVFRTVLAGDIQPSQRVGSSGAILARECTRTVSSEEF